MAIRSYFSDIRLHSISSKVVLPDPTGPPTPIRRGGRDLVRDGGVVPKFRWVGIMRPFFRIGINESTGSRGGTTGWQVAAPAYGCEAAGVPRDSGLRCIGRVCIGAIDSGCAVLT